MLNLLDGRFGQTGCDNDSDTGNIFSLICKYKGGTYFGTKYIYLINDTYTTKNMPNAILYIQVGGLRFPKLNFIVIYMYSPKYIFSRD